MAPKAVRNAAGTVIGLELPGDDHPDGIAAMIPVLPIPEGTTVGEPEEQADPAKQAELDQADRDELARRRDADESAKYATPAIVDVPTELTETEREELDELRAEKAARATDDHEAAGTSSTTVSETTTAPTEVSASGQVPSWLGGPGGVQSPTR